ncbi:hypothetical protein ACFQ34_14970 [Pseudonocardia benzenivorans]|uniref:Uncharacterized protein n=1 Tax=Pseudonocardia benzenivorans TaxID=228005 RepID=A0ABW3VJR8_9PSEU|nr:hypothetical protein PSD17_68200 [Pseudonocardia sp. D17]
MSISTPATTSTSTLGTPTAATRPLWIAAAVLTIVGLAIGLASATYAVVSAWVLVGAGVFALADVLVRRHRAGHRIVRLRGSAPLPR